MRRTNERPDHVTGQIMKPIGLAFAAVVAGLGATALGAQAHEEAPAAPALEPHAPTPHTQAHRIDPTNHAGFDQDESMILGPSEAVEPFADAPAQNQGARRQRDLFEL